MSCVSVSIEQNLLWSPDFSIQLQFTNNGIMMILPIGVSFKRRSGPFHPPLLARTGRTRPISRCRLVLRPAEPRASRTEREDVAAQSPTRLQKQVVCLAWACARVSVVCFCVTESTRDQRRGPQVIVGINTHTRTHKQ